MDFLLCLVAALLGFHPVESDPPTGKLKMVKRGASDVDAVPRSGNDQSGHQIMQQSFVPEIPSLRLEGGMGPCAGRVEVFYQLEWGTVCDDEWDILDAHVVCRQLNCGTAVRAPEGAFFGQGSARIWLDNVNCMGTETSLQQCRHPAWGRNNCRHEEDAGVVCSAATAFLDGDIPSPAIQDQQKSDGLVSLQAVAIPKGATTVAEGVIPTSGPSHKEESDEFIRWQTAVSSKGRQDSVRLVGGITHCSGRVEIFHGTEWGTVCDDEWDIRDAAVVCKQLGCGPAILAYGRAKFGLGSGMIWLDDVHCTGVESSLAECKKMPWGSSNCKHDEDASVVCAAGQGVTLVNGPGHCAGRVEVFYENNWGTICDDLWGLTNAQVVCQQLGCGAALSAPGAAFFGEGKGPIWLDNVNCTGQESSVLDCASEPWGKHNCRHQEDAGVVCSDELLESRFTESHNESTVPKQKHTTVPQFTSALNTMQPEIETNEKFPERKPSEDSITGQETEKWFNGLPPPIVGDFFDETPAPPMRPPEEGPPGSSVQQTSPAITQWPTVVKNEIEAQSVEMPLSKSTHQTPETLGIRLAGGPNRCSGRVEVYHNQEWGTVCDDGWGLLDALVACRQLGCGPVVSYNSLYGPGSGPIWKDELACYGMESSLTQCNSQPWGDTDCDHNEDAGLQCRDGTSVDDIDENVSVLPPTQEASTRPEGSPKPATTNVTSTHVNCVCHNPMAACECQQLPELVKIMGEMKGNFSFITHLLQEEKDQLQSMASSMREMASSLRQLLEMFTAHFSKRSPVAA